MGNGCRTVDPKKIDGLQKLAPPTNITQLKSFLGGVGWYRECIPDFTKKSAPLN